VLREVPPALGPTEGGTTKIDDQIKDGRRQSSRGDEAGWGLLLKDRPELEV